MVIVVIVNCDKEFCCLNEYFREIIKISPTTVFEKSLKENTFTVKQKIFKYEFDIIFIYLVNLYIIFLPIFVLFYIYIYLRRFNFLVYQSSLT